MYQRLNYRFNYAVSATMVIPLQMMNESMANLNGCWKWLKHIFNIPALSCKDWPKNNENLENCEFNSETRMGLTCHLQKSTLGYNEITILKYYFSFPCEFHTCNFNIFMKILHFLPAISSNFYIFNCSQHLVALESREHTYDS
jgi:hypothetical protein